jgi:hypothetical protein
MDRTFLCLLIQLLKQEILKLENWYELYAICRVKLNLAVGFILTFLGEFYVLILNFYLFVGLFSGAE